MAVYREWGPGPRPRAVFFLGGGLLEISGPSGRAGDGAAPPVPPSARPARRARAPRRAALGVPIEQEPAVRPWGLFEMVVRDPDGMALVFVEVPPNHPLRASRLTRWVGWDAGGSGPRRARDLEISQSPRSAFAWAGLERGRRQRPPGPRRSSPSASKASRAGAGSRPSSAVSASRACARSCTGSGLCQPSALARSARAERFRRASSRVTDSELSRQPGRRVATAGRSWPARHERTRAAVCSASVGLLCAGRAAGGGRRPRRGRGPGLFSVAGSSLWIWAGVSVRASPPDTGRGGALSASSWHLTARVAFRQMPSAASAEAPEEPPRASSAATETCW